MRPPRLMRAVGRHKMRMRKLNGWQRLWLVLTGAALIYALGWGFVQGGSGGGERVNQKVIAGFANPMCQSIVKMPAQTKLSQEPDGDNPCWELYLYRTIYENASTSADGYIESRRRDWLLGSIGIGLLLWFVSALLAYAVGFLVAWVRRGFATERS